MITINSLIPLMSDCLHHSLYNCEPAVTSLKEVYHLALEHNNDELSFQDRELLIDTLNVFKLINSDLINRWKVTQDTSYRGSWELKLHNRLEFAIQSIELIVED